MNTPPLESPERLATPPSQRETVANAVLASVSPLYRGVVAKAFEGTASPRAAIKAHCLVCTDCDRAEISACRVLRCALWLYRPYQRGDEE